MKKVVAIYHKDCSDGTAAAAVILKKFPEARVFPFAHSYKQEDLNKILDEIDSDTDFYTVDCAMAIKDFLSKTQKVTTIDHHISAKEECENIARENPNYTFVFDNDKCGSSLTWSYLFPDQKVPQLIKYVEDVDLWRWKYGDETKNVINYFSMFSNIPEEFLKYFDSDLADIKEFGRAITMYKDEKEKQYSEILPIKLKIDEYEVLAFNLVNSRSEMGNTFSKKYNQTVLLYNIDGDNVLLSFRANDGHKPSALELATLLGGGGHDKAAGGKIPLKKFLEMIVLE